MVNYLVLLILLHPQACNSCNAHKDAIEVITFNRVKAPSMEDCQLEATRYNAAQETLTTVDGHKMIFRGVCQQVEKEL